MARNCCRKSSSCPSPLGRIVRRPCLYGPACGARNANQSIFYDSYIEKEECPGTKMSSCKKYPAAIIVETCDSSPCPDPCMESSICLPSASKCISYEECPSPPPPCGNNKKYVAVDCSQGMSERMSYRLVEIVALLLTFTLLALLCCFCILMLINLAFNQGTNSGWNNLCDSLLIIALIVFTGICFKLLLRACTSFKSVLILMVVWIIWSLLYNYRALFDRENEVSVPLFGDKADSKGGGGGGGDEKKEGLMFLVLNVENQHAWDLIQREHMCCGIDGPESWINKNLSIPLSCCHNNTLLGDPFSVYCNSKKAGSYLYQKGCVEYSYAKHHEHETKTEEEPEETTERRKKKQHRRIEENEEDDDLANEEEENFVPKKKPHRRKSFRHHRRYPRQDEGESTTGANGGDDEEGGKLHVVQLMVNIMWYAITALFFLVAVCQVM